MEMAIQHEGSIDVEDLAERERVHNLPFNLECEFDDGNVPGATMMFVYRKK